MLTFEEYKAQRDQLSNWHREIGRELSAYPKNEIGMTVESIRNTQEYKAKRALCNKVFQQLRILNGKYIKTYKKELADERKQRWVK